MADGICVLNASPLILLGKLERLDLIEALGRRILIPKSVVDEIAAGNSEVTARSAE